MARPRGSKLPVRDALPPRLDERLEASALLSVTVSGILSLSLTMHLLTGLAFLASLRAAAAHGGHEHDGPQPGETVAQYAQRHVSTRATSVGHSRTCSHMRTPLPDGLGASHVRQRV